MPSVNRYGQSSPLKSKSQKPLASPHWIAVINGKILSPSKKNFFQYFYLVSVKSKSIPKFVCFVELQDLENRVL